MFLSKKLVLVFVLTLMADWFTKHYIAKVMLLGQTKPIIDGFFSLTLVHNTGAAFGMGNAMNRGLFYALSVCALLLLIYYFYKMQFAYFFSKVGATLVVAGAIGNLYDRIVQGYVVDFLDFYYRSYHWYTFNVADIAICVGAGLILLENVLHSKTSSKEV